ncbi:MAG: ParB/RepB/Spo0J family partition protein [Pseudomonadota bacterium]
MATTSALGKLATRASAADNGDSREIHIPQDKIVFDPDQPRKAFSESTLQEMAESLKEHGQIQAITVQDNGDGTYIVVIGERRTRGSRIAGLPTVRAKVRNDLTNSTKRLLFQLAENVEREDLTELDLANSILVLMRDIPGKQVPMSQREIAASLSKSEGWVSRYVKFGDEQLQEKWVRTGILDSVEKVYRVSLLSEHVQAEIVQRAALPDGNPDRLETPLTRSVIDGFARTAKISKLAATVATAGETSAAAPDAGRADKVAAEAAAQDNVGATLANLVKEGYEAKKPTTAPATNANAKTNSAPQIAAPQNSGSYQLPATAREKILSSEPTPPARQQTEATAEQPVHCKVEAASIVALLQLLEQSDKDVRKAASSLQCSVVIPGSLAQMIAYAMTKKKLAPGEVAATVQRELAKLR